MKSKLFGLFFVLALLASLLGASSASAQAPLPPAQLPGAGVSAASIPLGAPGLSFRYVKTFGETGVAYLADTRHINYPWGIGTVGNNVWIGEYMGNRALKYNGAGAFLQKIGNAGNQDLPDTGLSEIADVVQDAGGNIWLADANGSHVAEFNSSGHLVKELGVIWQRGNDNSHLGYPVSVALDSNGNIYVSDGAPWWSTDVGNQRIQIFDTEGYYLATIGETGVPGTDSNHLYGPQHIAIYGTLLYVADSGNQRVEIFNISNPAAPFYVARLGTSGVMGADTTHFNYPSGVAVDTDYIYVADTGNYRVQAFNRTTRAYVKTIGGTWGAGKYQFKYPSDVAVDAAHRLYVADYDNARVQQFTHSGATFTYALTYGVTGVPYLSDGYHYRQPRVAIDNSDNILILEERGQRLIKLNSQGTVQWSVGAAGVEGSDNGHFTSPHGVATDIDGNVYVADNCRVQTFSPAGVYLHTLGTGCGTGDYEFGWATGIDVDKNGKIYVADYSNHRVQVYDSGRTYMATIGETGIPGSDNMHLSTPIAVAVDASGNVYVTDAGNGRIQKFDSSLVWQMTIGDGTWGSGFGQFAWAEDVVVDAQGRIYVTDWSNDRVEVFDPSGGYLTTIGGSWGTGTSQFKATPGVAVDNSGNVYVADWGNDRIQKFALGVPGWTQSNINGFGDRWLQGTARVATFGSDLYAGAGLAPAQIWKTSDGSAWSPMVTDGFGDPTNSGVTDMVEFDSAFYASTWSCPDDGCASTNHGQILRSTDGAAWDPVLTGGFGATDSIGIGALAVFSNKIYAGTIPVNGALQIHWSSTGDLGDWHPAMTDGFGGGGVEGDPIMDVYDGYLYVGIARNGVGELWRTDDGTTWLSVFTNGLAVNNSYVASMAEFNGAFYVGLQNDQSGGQIWRSTDGLAFTRVATGGLGRAANNKPTGLYAANGSLYLVFVNWATGAEVWRTPDGVNWTRIGSGGWGDANNGEADAGDNGAAAYGGRLYIGTFNFANGGEIWSMPLPQTDAFTSAGAQDGWILESGENTGVGGTMKATGTTFNLGDDATKKQYRAVLSFDTSGLPEGAVIQSAVLRIKQSGAPVGINPFNVLGKLLVDIRKPYFGTQAGLQLADFKAASSAAKVGSFGKAPASGWYSVKLNATGLTKINTSGLTQFRLYFSLDDNNNLLANYMKFFSGEAASGNQPILYITYLAP